MSLHKSLNTQTSKILLYKHLLSKISQNLKTKQSGFTLIELLVAMVILTIVVGMTGTGLVFVMSTNTKSDGQITQQSNIRRAADFISDEIKAASVVTTTDPQWIGGTGMTPITSSTAIGINPVGQTINPVGTSPTQAQLFLEIPTPVDCINAISPSTTLTTLIVPNHGLVKGNAIRFSGNNLSAAGITNNTTTYYVATVSAITTPTNCNGSITTSTNNAFTVVDSSNAAVSFTATPQNFAVRRLVNYYTATLTSSDALKWKGPQALYRATGNCNASSAITYTSDASNCLVMIDSLTISPFIVNTSTTPNTLTINGQLCTPPTMSNTCPSPSPTPDLTSITVQAVSRGTLK